jgi:hypothetical protein
MDDHSTPELHPLECRICGSRRNEVLIGNVCGDCLVSDDYGDARARLFSLAR